MGLLQTHLVKQTVKQAAQIASKMRTLPLGTLFFEELAAEL